jgi:DnaJ-class molecular chaperone
MKTRKVEINLEAVCRNCNGSGQSKNNVCEICDGVGVVNIHKDIYITVTPAKKINSPNPNNS